MGRKGDPPVAKPRRHRSDTPGCGAPLRRAHPPYAAPGRGSVFSFGAAQRWQRQSLAGMNPPVALLLPSPDEGRLAASDRVSALVADFCEGGRVVRRPTARPPTPTSDDRVLADAHYVPVQVRNESDTRRQMDAVLHALADGSRRTVLEILRDHPATAGDLADALPIARPGICGCCVRRGWLTAARRRSGESTPCVSHRLPRSTHGWRITEPCGASDLTL